MPTAPVYPAARSAIPASLLELAPLRLRNRRSTRYTGGDQFVQMERLAQRDQTLVRHLYQALGELLSLIADSATDDAGKWRAVASWVVRCNLDLLIGDAREIGLATHEQDRSEALSKAVHDVRGGALSALLGRLQLLGYLPHTETNLKTIFVLTRDHLKIMRNAVVGLDEPRRRADLTPKTHAMRLMVEKWHESVAGPQWRERPIQMFIDSRYDGPLTECCLESAAIDRIFYNLTSNACRHASDDRLDMAIFPIPEPPGDCLRFVLSNRISEADAAGLEALGASGGADSTDRGRGRSLFVLFEPEVSTTGSGYGLAIVADFVVGAFGLSDRAEALRERYVGAILDGQTFQTWFHWPMSHADLPAKLDDYHHPLESLSEP